MPKLTHEKLGIDIDAQSFNHGKTVAFERALKSLGVQGGEIPREWWGAVVEAAIDAEIIPPFAGGVDEQWPATIEWLAQELGKLHAEATRIDPN
jgi:hypothetical protein